MRRRPELGRLKNFPHRKISSVLSRRAYFISDQCHRNPQPRPTRAYDMAPKKPTQEQPGDSNYEAVLRAVVRPKKKTRTRQLGSPQRISQLPLYPPPPPSSSIHETDQQRYEQLAYHLQKLEDCLNVISLRTALYEPDTPSDISDSLGSVRRAATLAVTCTTRLVRLKGKRRPWVPDGIWSLYHTMRRHYRNLVDNLTEGKYNARFDANLQKTIESMGDLQRVIKQKLDPSTTGSSEESECFGSWLHSYLSLTEAPRSPLPPDEGWQ